MAFNLGVEGLMGFRETLDLIYEDRYRQASAEMLRSRWATQVGERAQRLSRMMASGNGE